MYDRNKLSYALQVFEGPLFGALAAKASIERGKLFSIGIEPVDVPERRCDCFGGMAMLTEGNLLHNRSLAAEGLRCRCEKRFYLSKFWKMLPIKQCNEHRRGHEDRTTPT